MGTYLLNTLMYLIAKGWLEKIGIHNFVKYKQNPKINDFSTSHLI